MKKVVIVVVLNIIVKSIIVCQSDTTLNIPAKENSTEYSLSDKHDYLDLVFRKETRIFKIGISPLNLIEKEKDAIMGSFGCNVSYEKKIIPSISHIISSDAEILYFSGPGEVKSSNRRLGLNYGLRYYYSLNKKIRDLEAANNFHSNYLSMDISYKTITEAGDFGDFDYKWLSDMVAINIYWGMQRRIGKLGFFDLSPYLAIILSDVSSLNNQRLHIGAKLILGLAWGKNIE